MARKLHLSAPKWVRPFSEGRGGRDGKVTGEVTRGRDRRAGAETGFMRFAGIDITSELQVHSLQARGSDPCCSACRRRLLPGETLHVYESGGSLCTLCVGARTEQPLRRERVHATSARLAVVPRAA